MPANKKKEKKKAREIEPGFDEEGSKGTIEVARKKSRKAPKAESPQDLELKENVAEDEVDTASKASIDSREGSVLSFSSDKGRFGNEATEKETSFVKEDDFEESINKIEEDSIKEPPEKAASFVKDDDSKDAIEKETSFVERKDDEKSGIEKQLLDSASSVDQSTEEKSPKVESAVEDDPNVSSALIVTSHTKSEETVAYTMTSSMQVKIKGAVMDESSTDAQPENISLPLNLNNQEEQNNNVNEPDVSKISEEKSAVDLDSQGDAIIQDNQVQDVDAVRGNQESSDNLKRRNLDPDGKPEDMHLNESEFSKPNETGGSKIKQDADVNKNIIPEHEILAGNADVKDKDDESDDDNDELPWAMYKNMKSYDRPSDAEDEFSEDDDALDEPLQRNHIPELYEYLGSLDNGETELESKHIPPSLFENDEQHHMHKKISQTKLALAEEEIGAYLEEFEKCVEEEVLMIGNIGLSEVQEEERHIREEHIEYQQAEAKIQRDKRQELNAAMERAKKHVMKVFREKYGRVKDKEGALMERDRRIQGQITKAFRKSENQLQKALRKRKSEVMNMYGDLVFADRELGGGKGKRWKVDWDKTQQPIQIKLKCLRSVRDKLPFGEYVLMVSLYSRLGGHVMKWSNLRGQKWGAATLPLLHEGEYYNIELKIDQSVFTVCPSKPDIRPGMVLMFELFILSGDFTITDKVVAWGSFPICDGAFNVVEGKYKTPLMRGNIDSSVEKFQTIEERMANDLEHWLCNLYFEIIKLPRYLLGQKEYEVELQFSSGLVSYPIRTKTGEEFVDGEQPLYGSVSDMASIAASRVSMPNSRANSALILKNPDVKPTGSNIMLKVEPPNLSSKKHQTSRPSSAVSLSMKLQKASEISTELRQRRGSHTSANLHPADDVVSRKLSVFGSRKSIDDRSMAFSDETDSGSGTDYNDDDVCAVKKDNGFRIVKGQPGMYYKVHQNNPVDVYGRKLLNTMPQTAQPSMRKKKKKLTRQDELKQHSYNVKSVWSDKGHIPREGREKLQYIGRMMLAELGFSQWRKGQFWVTLFMLLATWFMRMYLHYFGQWVLLKGLSIPINKYNFYPHTVNLNYQDTLLQARHEIGVVMMGPFFNLFLFTILIPITILFQRTFKWFPDLITHFILAFGIQTFLDPFWILVVDCILGRYNNTGGVEPIGDAFKLYWHFYRNYRNDNVTLYVSISMTTFLYVVIAFSTAALWYMFFVRLHNNGRLMDIYWRLHGSEDEFFLPYDLEVSNEELNFICRKSEQWRGEEGERRKVAVYDYVWEQEEMADECWDNPNAHGEKTGAKEITTHVSIHCIHPDGLIELHRQFLRLPDGAIIEVFGEMNMPGIDEGVKQALLKSSGFKGVSNTVKRNRSLSVTSMASSTGGKNPVRRMSSNRLDVPV